MDELHVELPKMYEYLLWMCKDGRRVNAWKMPGYSPEDAVTRYLNIRDKHLGNWAQMVNPPDIDVELDGVTVFSWVPGDGRTVLWRALGVEQT